MPEPITIETVRDGVIIRGDGLILFKGDRQLAYKILLHHGYRSVTGMNGVWVKS